MLWTHKIHGGTWTPELHILFCSTACPLRRSITQFIFMTPVFNCDHIMHKIPDSLAHVLFLLSSSITVARPTSLLYFSSQVGSSWHYIVSQRGFISESEHSATYTLQLLVMHPSFIPCSFSFCWIPLPSRHPSCLRQASSLFIWKKGKGAADWGKAETKPQNHNI